MRGSSRCSRPTSQKLARSSTGPSTGEGPLKISGIGAVDRRREQHRLIARHEIAAHDDELSLVEAGVGEQRRGRRGASLRDLGVRPRGARCTSAATDTEGGAVEPHVSFDCTCSSWNRYKILVKLAIKRKQLSDQVSELTTNRLSVYLRCLNTLDADGVKTVSSQALAHQFHLNAAQIRKDLAYFGEFGVRGVGYYVKDLKQHLRQILGLDRRLKVAIFGAGNLGLALADYPGFSAGRLSDCRAVRHAARQGRAEVARGRADLRHQGAAQDRRRARRSRSP